MTRFLSAIDLRLRLALVAGAAAIVLPIAWYLGSPLFINQTVNEAFPSAAAPLPAAGDPMAEPAGDPMAEPAGDPMAEPMADPIPLRSGSFGMIDSIHRGEGAATIYQLPDGRRVLRFEESFKVTNGPDLYVYLSGSAAPRSSEELHAGAAFEVDRLKGNIGSQNYELPADLDLGQFKSVVIYCRRFSVVFSTADLM